jgi:hypothetical protein
MPSNPETKVFSIILLRTIPSKLELLERVEVNVVYPTAVNDGVDYPLCH